MELSLQSQYRAIDLRITVLPGFCYNFRKVNNLQDQQNITKSQYIVVFIAITTTYRERSKKTGNYSSPRVTLRNGRRRACQPEMPWVVVQHRPLYRASYKQGLRNSLGCEPVRRGPVRHRGETAKHTVTSRPLSPTLYHGMNSHGFHAPG
jgi:hypothetical protein